MMLICFDDVVFEMVMEALLVITALGMRWNIRNCLYIQLSAERYKERDNK